MLAPLARRGAVILHDRALGKVANLDHLAIGHWGIACINTKNWQARGTRVAVSPDGGTLWYGAHAQNREVAKAQGRRGRPPQPSGARWTGCRSTSGRSSPSTGLRSAVAAS
ncbi:hypothetical protein SHKM778_95020 (plasmid) [Streptomyces sp. KM77-8]|uniref:NERD domain-containing protein n=1 Tax=Streptomyces haneummycinicus TaxID=3074435 RepID=A0AAT9I0L7_9ACTN